MYTIQQKCFRAIKAIAIFVVCTILFISCKKTTSCYSESLQKASANIFCTQDCPGVIGCDGKTYCNACIASQSGISVP